MSTCGAPGVDEREYDGPRRQYAIISSLAHSGWRTSPLGRGRTVAAEPDSAQKYPRTPSVSATYHMETSVLVVLLTVPIVVVLLILPVSGTPAVGPMVKPK